MTQMEKIFSELVFGETFPKPTLVRLLKVKYRAVTYLSLMEGPDLLTESLYGFPSCSPRLSNQPIPAEVDRSTLPMAYLVTKEKQKWIGLDFCVLRRLKSFFPGP